METIDPSAFCPDNVQRLKYMLYGHESAFCHVEVTADCKYAALISYETRVCELIRGKNFWWFTCTGNYSRSTIKHITWFLRSFGVPFGYSVVRQGLLDTQRANRKYNRCDEFMVEQIDDVSAYVRIAENINNYLINGKRWYKYSKEPCYDKLYYGCSNFNAINLP